jgi:two-component system NtrC family sensor kinase
VFLNIISNARYALNSRWQDPEPEKILKIQGRLFEQNGETFIKISFKDFGMGIPSNIRTRLFDPFFSTKPKGEGTGLGLSISHGLISDHGGRISVESKRGAWTCFTIDLPCGDRASKVNS